MPKRRASSPPRPPPAPGLRAGRGGAGAAGAGALPLAFHLSGLQSPDRDVRVASEEAIARLEENVARFLDELLSACEAGGGAARPAAVILCGVLHRREEREAGAEEGDDDVDVLPLFERATRLLHSEEVADSQILADSVEKVCTHLLRPAIRHPDFTPAHLESPHGVLLLRAAKEVNRCASPALVAALREETLRIAEEVRAARSVDEDGAARCANTLRALRCFPLEDESVEVLRSFAPLLPALLEAGLLDRDRRAALLRAEAEEEGEDGEEAVRGERFLLFLGGAWAAAKQVVKAAHAVRAYHEEAGFAEVRAAFAHPRLRDMDPRCVSYIVRDAGALRGAPRRDPDAFLARLLPLMDFEGGAEQTWDEDPDVFLHNYFCEGGGGGRGGGGSNDARSAALHLLHHAEPLRPLVDALLLYEPTYSTLSALLSLLPRLRRAERARVMDVYVLPRLDADADADDDVILATTLYLCSECAESVPRPAALLEHCVGLLREGGREESAAVIVDALLLRCVRALLSEHDLSESCGDLVQHLVRFVHDSVETDTSCDDAADLLDALVASDFDAVLPHAPAVAEALLARCDYDIFDGEMESPALRSLSRLCAQLTDRTPRFDEGDVWDDEETRDVVERVAPPCIRYLTSIWDEGRLEEGADEDADACDLPLPPDSLGVFAFVARAHNCVDADIPPALRHLLRVLASRAAERWEDMDTYDDAWEALTEGCRLLLYSLDGETRDVFFSACADVAALFLRRGAPPTVRAGAKLVITLASGCDPAEWSGGALRVGEALRSAILEGGDAACRLSLTRALVLALCLVAEDVPPEILPYVDAALRFAAGDEFDLRRGVWRLLLPFCASEEVRAEFETAQHDTPPRPEEGDDEMDEAEDADVDAEWEEADEDAEWEDADADAEDEDDGGDRNEMDAADGYGAISVRGRDWRLE